MKAYRFNVTTKEFAGELEVQDGTSLSAGMTTISPLGEDGITVTGNYFDEEKGIWFNPAPTPSSQDETLAMVTQQIATLLLANASLTKTVAQLVAGTKGNEG